MCPRIPVSLLQVLLYRILLERTIDLVAKALISLMAFGARFLKVQPCSYRFVSPLLNQFLSKWWHSKGIKARSQRYQARYPQNTP